MKTANDETKIEQCLYETRLQCAACNSAYEWAMSFDAGTDQREIAMSELRREREKMDALWSRLANLRKEG